MDGHRRKPRTSPGAGAHLSARRARQASNEFGPYDLRHSFASLLLHEGPSVIYVARQLGHVARLTLTRYGHVIDELEDMPHMDAAAAIIRASGGPEIEPQLEGLSRRARPWHAQSEMAIDALGDGASAAFSPNDVCVPVPPAPPPSSPAVRAVMRGNRGSDTRPEVALRSALHRRGLRFRKDAVPPGSGVRCRADVVFTAARLAVFVDGCFWHRCPEHGTRPRTNGGYWQAKLDRNVARDRANDAALAAAGWRVVRVWEHEDPASAAQRIAAVLAAKGKPARRQPMAPTRAPRRALSSDSALRR